jgi:hypothetical protein
MKKVFMILAGLIILPFLWLWEGKKTLATLAIFLFLFAAWTAIVGAANIYVILNWLPFIEPRFARVSMSDSEIYTMAVLPTLFVVIPMMASVILSQFYVRTRDPGDFPPRTAVWS